MNLFDFAAKTNEIAKKNAFTIDDVKSSLISVLSLVNSNYTPILGIVLLIIQIGKSKVIPVGQNRKPLQVSENI